MRHVLILLAALAAAASFHAAFAQEPVTADGLRIGIVERPPFAVRDETMGWSGLAVDLLRQIAEEQGLNYQLVEIDGTPKEAVASGSVAMAFPADAGPREDGVAYTQPFYTSTLGLATSRSVDLWSIARSILSWQLLRAILFLSALLLIVGAIVWAIERKANEEMFPREPRQGLGAGFWWAGVTMTTIGYGDKAPITVWGRAVAMLWMLAAIAISAALTATIVSAVGVGGGSGLPDDLDDRRIGVIADSTAERYLEARGLVPVIVADAVAGLRAVGDGLDGFLGDEPLVRSLVSGRDALDLAVTGSTIDPHYVSFAVADGLGVNGTALEKRFNDAILKRLPTPAWWELTQRYVPGDD